MRKLWLTLALVASLAAKDPPRAPINVNTATAQQLQQLPGIGPTRAAQIIRLREKNGPFRSVEELRAIPRLSEKQFQQLKRYVTVQSPTK
ncbi:MAG: helix-hairpin-helix domain-containing protein [Acidobacteria bacterium]|nr:helix-hairpin-helix domain-containing protein [Acidobacteriota bacterium]